MLSPKHQRYADRLRELIEEGRTVANLGISTEYGLYIRDQVSLHAWLAKVRNIIETVFSMNSPQYQHHAELIKGDTGDPHQVSRIVGLLTGALDDLENGYLVGQEFIIAAEVFDSVLEQAKHLNQAGHKDPAAVLTRVVLEDSLKRLAREESIDDTLKATRINDELKKVGKYTQPQWRLVQSWLDTGNAAAHGNFSDYSQENVERLIEDIERFLAAHFSSS